MKPTLLFFFLLYCGGTFAQPASGTTSHFMKFEVVVADTLLHKLDPSQPEKTSEKDKVKANQNFLYQTLRSMMQDSIHAALAERGVQVLDNDTLRHYLKLGTDGFPLLALSPKGPIKKLKKQGYRADLYLNLTATVDLAGFSSFSKGIQPEVRVQLNAWDEEGKSVQKIDHREKNQGTMLAKIDRDHPLIKFQQTEKTSSFSGQSVKFDKTKRSFVQMLIDELEPLVADAVEHAMAKWK